MQCLLLYCLSYGYFIILLERTYSVIEEAYIIVHYFFTREMLDALYFEVDVRFLVATRLILFVLSYYTVTFANCALYMYEKKIL